jgi:energy-coupling factor transporter ATP-binding protein EcfA2
MSEDQSSTFDSNQWIYTPTPEAKALEWDSLCPGTRDALKKIILWLDAACVANSEAKNNTEKVASEYEAPSTSILVAGDRGSGKTTVLLSAAYIYRLASQNNYLYNMGNEHPLKTPLDNSHQKVTWLNTLDLESLYPDSNLLAAMLVRIRGAIEKMDGDDNEKGDDGERRIRRRSILEGDLGTGESLTRLIDDATFMWEKLPGGNSRVERSSQQIKAAEISADFQNKFKDVMEKTISLVKNRGKNTELFVLPIDNVDRSIEHIASISKLVRLAASRRLWFILAAVRPDYQLFLERSFQNELLRSSTGSNASNWDQTQAIARRQAATSMRRTLPEKYQILIKPLGPDYCWSYPNVTEINAAKDQQLVICNHKLKEFLKNPSCEKLTSDPIEINELCKSINELREEKGLEKLLRDISIISELKNENSKFQNFSQLFNIADNLDKKTKEVYQEVLKVDEINKNTGTNNTEANKKNIKNPFIFTDAAKMALGLSMRTLLDFRGALAYHHQDCNSDECAVEISVRMLRNAIDESDIPFWASDLLLNCIIRKNASGKWILDLTGEPIRRFNLKPLFSQIFFPVKFSNGKDFVIEDSLKWQNFPDTVMELHNLSVEGNSSIPLPSVIAGWFMIFYDLLVIRDKQRILSEKSLPNEVMFRVVQNCHKLIYFDTKKPSVQLLFDWETPEWPSFVEHFLFDVQWRTILFKLKTFIDKHETGYPFNEEVKKQIYRTIRLAWIDNICSVSGLVPKEESNKETERKLLEIALTASLCDISETDIDSYAIKVNTKLRSLVDSLLSVKSTATTGWLLKKLPLFMGPEYSQLTKQDVTYTKNDNWGQGKKQAQGTKWDALHKNWEEYATGLESLRKDIVRSAIKKCLGPKAASDEIDTVMGQWFSAVDIKDKNFWD